LYLLISFFSGTAVGDDAVAAGANMDKWLERLERQLSATLVREPKSNLPSLRACYKWVDELILGADTLYEQDLVRIGTMSWAGAFQNQSALVAAFTVGRFVPPVRIAILRSLLHPDAVGVGSGQGRNWRRCNDKDCRDPTRCSGNHFELAALPSGERGINFVAPHHKNDRRGFEQIKFRIPCAGPLNRLLLRHFDSGHALLTQATGQDVPNLFVTRRGGAFTAVTFTHQWKTLMRSSSEIEYFCPSLARTAFVSEYTNTSGLPADMWDGAATVMGNTVKMWNKEYNPQKRLREAQAAVDVHETFATRIMMAEAEA
jgi:hypothetical protein